MNEPDWLVWAREMQAIAQSGLTFTADVYDRGRYEQLQQLSARIVVAYSAANLTHVENVFAEQAGYATPKIDVRAAAFDAAGRILMVRETADAGRWTLPGGWADVNLSAAENTAKEVAEESGFQVRVRKLAAVWDRGRQGHHPPIAFSTYKMFFICDITGGAAAVSSETSEVGFFGREEIPADLSTGRVLPHQIQRMFDHARQPDLPTEFD